MRTKSTIWQQRKCCNGHNWERLSGEIAFNTGDHDKALYYIYPDAFEYLIQKYPDEQINMQEIKDSLFIEPIIEIKKLVKEKK